MADAAAKQLADAGWVFAAIEALYQEITAVCDRIEKLLDSGRADEEFVLEVGDLVAQWIRLGERERRLSDQRWAVWVSRNTTAFGGVGE